jgi:hypothetical protein
VPALPTGVMRRAASNGHLHVVRWVRAHPKGKGCESDFGTIAANAAEAGLALFTTLFCSQNTNDDSKRFCSEREIRFVITASMVLVIHLTPARVTALRRGGVFADFGIHRRGEQREPMYDQVRDGLRRWGCTQSRVCVSLVSLGGAVCISLLSTGCVSPLLLADIDWCFDFKNKRCEKCQPYPPRGEVTWPCSRGCAPAARPSTSTPAPTRRAPVKSTPCGGSAEGLALLGV